MILAGFSDKTGGQILNLASGKDFSIEEMVKIVGDILGKRLIIKVEKRRKRPRGSEVQRLLGDSILAENLIGYKANHTFKMGLTKTIRFYEKNFDYFSKEDYQI